MPLLPLSPAACGSRRLLAAVFFLAGFALASTGLQAGLLWGPNWKKVTDEEMALSEPKIDPEAGVEILFQEVKIDDSEPHKAIFDKYIRLKVFNERGVEALKTIDIDIVKDHSIMELAARIIQPDGTIIELGRKDAYSRETKRWGGVRVKTHSFPAKGLVPGSIVEYQWVEVKYGSANGSICQLGARYPVHYSRFRFLPYEGVRSRLTGYMLTGKIERDGRYTTTEMRDVPAVPDEPFAVSYLGVQPWIVVNYISFGEKDTPEDFWKRVSKYMDEWGSDEFKHRAREIREKAEELTAGVSDRDEALKRIYEFCTREIRNSAAPNTYLSSDQLDKLEDADAVDALENGYAYPSRVAYLFGSLAKAAGFEVKLGVCNDRTYIDWSVNNCAWTAVPDYVVAVKVNETWRLFDPATPFIPYGCLHYGHENTVAVLGNDREMEVVRTPVAAAASSLVERKARLKLDENGNLSGSVTITFSGHRAVDLKMDYGNMTNEAREDAFVSDLRACLPGAEVSNFVLENIEDPSGDVSVNFDISVAAYADATGQRMFVQPSFFQKGVEPVFKADTRKLLVRIPYGSVTNDRVMIEYPEGYEVEEGSAPLSLADTKLFKHSIVLGKVKGRNMIMMQRSVMVDFMDLKVDQYPGIKGLFDAVDVQDGHIVTLRKSEAAPEDTAPEEPTPAATAKL